MHLMVREDYSKTICLDCLYHLEAWLGEEVIVSKRPKEMEYLIERRCNSCGSGKFHTLLGYQRF